MAKIFVQIYATFYKGVVVKLRDSARDVVSGIEINIIESLKNALKPHFSPKKTHTQYTAEMQGIRLRKNEPVLKCFGRIKTLLEEEFRRSPCAKYGLDAQGNVSRII